TSARSAATRPSFRKSASRSTSRTPTSITTFRCCSARSATRRIEAASVLAWNRYGKSRVRLVKLRRARDPHEIVDLTIDVQVEGAFEAVYGEGGNGASQPPHPMRSPADPLAGRHPMPHVEAFALRRGDHFIGKPAGERVVIRAIEHRGDRLSVNARAHPHGFAQPGGKHWTA